MIIVRTPLRISIAGGGTDLPVWYKEHGSMFISGAIDKYIYITCHRSGFDPRIRLRYSRMEEVDTLDEIQHEIIKETFKMYGVKDNIELTSHAEIPSGTGVGSSGSFGVGIIHAIYGNGIRPRTLARDATVIQMGILKHPIGIQDQYVAAFGGVNVYTIKEDGQVNVKPLKAPVEELAQRLALFFTGFKHDTKEVLKQSTTEGLGRIQELAWNAKTCLEECNFDGYGWILREHWEEKKKRGPMSNPQIDEWYELGLKNGAIGGKLVGAGGGGFLLFYVKDKEKLIKAMPLKYVPFKFDMEGSKVLIDD